MVATKSEARQAEARERLQQAIDALATEDGWVRWLDLRARMHGYSVNNLILIAMQRPDATHVAGYRAWQALGSQVRKGEKAIRILAPIVRRRETDDGDVKRIVAGFRTVNVFDIAQTDGDAIAGRPSIVDVTGDDPAGLYDRLAAIVSAEGLALDVEQLEPGHHGYIHRGERLVVLAEHLDAAGRAKTLAHELGHWFDLGPADFVDGLVPISRSDAEVVAESVAYIVTSAAGIDSAGYSAAYVLDWAACDTGRLAELARRVDRAASLILGAVEVDDEAEAA